MIVSSVEHHEKGYTYLFIYTLYENLIKIYKCSDIFFYINNLTLVLVKGICSF